MPWVCSRNSNYKNLNRYKNVKYKNRHILRQQSRRSISVAKALLMEDYKKKFINKLMNFSINEMNNHIQYINNFTHYLIEAQNEKLDPTHVKTLKLCARCQAENKRSRIIEDSSSEALEMIFEGIVRIKALTKNLSTALNYENNSLTHSQNKFINIITNLYSTQWKHTAELTISCDKNIHNEECKNININLALIVLFDTVDYILSQAFVKNKIFARIRFKLRKINNSFSVIFQIKNADNIFIDTDLSEFNKDLQDKIYIANDIVEKEYNGIVNFNINNCGILNIISIIPKYKCHSISQIQ